jgi:hypothetical protein
MRSQMHTIGHRIEQAKSVNAPVCVKAVIQNSIGRGATFGQLDFRIVDHDFAGVGDAQFGSHLQRNPNGFRFCFWHAPIGRVAPPGVTRLYAIFSPIDFGCKNCSR